MAQLVPKSNIPNYERREQALRLRTAGLTYVAIGREMGIGFSRARKLVIAAIEERRSRCDEQAEEVIRLELERLDGLFLALWPKREDPKRAEMLIRISERRSRLLGLDAPQRHEVTGKDGGPIKTEDTRDRNLRLIEQIAGRDAGSAEPGSAPERDSAADAGGGRPVSMGLARLVGPTESTRTDG